VSKIAKFDMREQRTRQMGIDEHSAEGKTKGTPTLRPHQEGDVTESNKIGTVKGKKKKRSLAIQSRYANARKNI